MENKQQMLYENMQDIYSDCMFQYFTVSVNRLFPDIFNSFFKKSLEYLITKNDFNDKDLSFLKKEIHLIAKSIITSVTIGSNEDRAEEIALGYFKILKQRYGDYENIFSVVKELTNLNSNLPFISQDNKNKIDTISPTIKNKNKI